MLAVKPQELEEYSYKTLSIHATTDLQPMTSNPGEPSTSDKPPGGIPFECVPNYSEGRDRALLAELALVAAEAGVQVLNVNSDRDHHRSVMTWVGTAAEIGAACSETLDLLARNRSLEKHHGVHPRTGLLDVVPIVPLSPLVPPVAPVPSSSARAVAPGQWVSASTLIEAISTARTVARRLAEAHGIATYLYGEAAVTSLRSNLADHRRALLGETPESWPPDFGPSAMNPILGCTLVGARRPLIAFNLDLETNNLRLARTIASRIRSSADSGLPGVKALGLGLESRNCAQVSVNLVDARATSLPALVERVVAEAQALGTRVRGAELIGLATREAVAGASASDLLLPELTPEQLIETHLELPRNAKGR